MPCSARTAPEHGEIKLRSKQEPGFMYSVLSVKRESRLTAEYWPGISLTFFLVDVKSSRNLLSCRSFLSARGFGRRRWGSAACHSILASSQSRTRTLAALERALSDGSAEPFCVTGDYSVIVLVCLFVTPRRGKPSVVHSLCKGLYLCTRANCQARRGCLFPRADTGRLSPCVASDVVCCLPWVDQRTMHTSMHPPSEYARLRGRHGH